MSYRHTFETTSVTLDGNQIKVEAIVKVFGSIAEQVSLDEVLSMENFNPEEFGDGNSEPAIAAGDDILDRLSPRERERIESEFENSAYARPWQSIMLGGVR